MEDDLPIPYFIPWDPRYSFASKHALLHQKSGAIITYVPKNACSSIKASLLCDAFGYEKQEFMGIANGGLHLATGMLLAPPSAIFGAKRSYVLLRNPMERVVSVFCDKFLSKWREAKLFAMVALNIPPHKIDQLSQEEALRVDQFISSLTFLDFLGYLKEPRMLNLDPHWRPQQHFILYRDYTYCGSMRRMEEFIDVLGQDIGVEWLDSRQFMKHGRDQHGSISRDEAWKIPVRELAEQKNVQKRLPSSESMLGDACRQLIRDIYRDDFTYLDNQFGKDSDY